MQAMRFDGEGGAQRVGSIDEVPEAPGFVWLDFVRGEEPDWDQSVAHVLGETLYPAHVVDAGNIEHPAFYDSAQHYEMIILTGLPDLEARGLERRPTCFFLFRNAVVSVRPADSQSLPPVAKKLEKGRIRIPRRPESLFHLLSNGIVDRYMAIRAPLTEKVDDWQRRLLDPDDPFDDWQSLMLYRVDLKRLDTLCEQQHEAITSWREETRFELDSTLSVRISDLLEHLDRVRSHIALVQQEIEAVVQVHFSALAHRTNEIMRVLTVLAGIFLPLSFLAGLFGMNFEYMPELKWKYSYFVLLGFMLSIGVGLLWWFRKRRWL